MASVAWKTKPSWYIVSKQDGAIAPDAERFFRQAHEGNDHGAGHEPCGNALEAERCGGRHHGRGGEGPALNIDCNQPPRRLTRADSPRVIAETA